MTYEQRKDRVCGKEWQDNFVKLHNDILQSRRPRRFIVFSCTLEGYKCAGYGNRLGGIASILFLSILTRRAFLIEWDQEVPLDMYLVPKAIEWNYSTENIKDLDTRIHYLGKRNHFKKRRNDVVHQWKMKADFVIWLLKTDIQTYFDRPVEKFVSNWYFADFLLENPFFFKQYVRGLGFRWEHSRDSLIGCAFDFLFQKSRELETRLNAARRSLGLASQVPKLGLQIRMGDVSFGQGVQNNHFDFEGFFFCAQAFGEALARRSVVTVVETIKWFLATDDTAVKGYALKNYPLNAVTLNITPKHIKYSNPLTENTTSQKIEDMFNVVIDHFLLSECDFLILSPSTFGKTAAALFFHSEATSISKDTCNKRLSKGMTPDLRAEPHFEAFWK